MTDTAMTLLPFLLTPISDITTILMLVYINFNYISFEYVYYHL